MTKFYATTDPAESKREIANRNRSRKIAAEGMVLLENNGILPLQLEERNIALFGNGARHTVPGGSGSGEVNSRAVTTIEQGLENAGAIITTKKWLDRFEEAAAESKKKFMCSLAEQYKDNPELAFWGMFRYRNPLTIPTGEDEFPLSDDEIAFYVLARHSGEGTDRKNIPGDYYLQEEEKHFLTELQQHYRHLVVILNVGGVIDTAFFREQEGIEAVLLMSQAGCAGGDALADVISGKVTPSGHLAATWAKRYDDYPSADTYGSVNGNVDDEYYTEGIYVGYRWFDSFGIEPAYPFGYGKSYTSFSVETKEIQEKEGTVSLQVQVTNIGTRYSGKEVVQVYVSAPEGEWEKPYQELAAYGKTELLQPGEAQILTLSFPVSRMASYDEKEAAWILESGDYLLRVGVDSRATRVSGILRVTGKYTVQKLSPVLPLDVALQEVHPNRENFYSYASEKEEIEEAPITIFDGIYEQENSGEIGAAEKDSEKKVLSEKVLTEKVLSEKKDDLTLEDVRAGRCTTRDLIHQLTVEELTALCVGTARGGQGESSTIGAASVSCPGAAGETTSLLRESRKIGNIILADGPAGLRVSPSYTVDAEGNMISEEPALGGDIISLFGKDRDAEEAVDAEKVTKAEQPADTATHYQYCTAIPVETMLAQTWNLDLLKEAGDIVGAEMKELGINLWLAPGMNIHRNPLCGRNFEYYSEDPLISGLCAAAETQGVQAYTGIGTTIKHFACNNQEDNRAYMISHVSERALREIYLKGFEIAVKQAKPLSVMSSYNMINGIHAANSVDLLTKVLREEWKYEGIVMTDWGTTAKAKPDLEGKLPKYGCSNAAACIKAGNDLIMPGSQEDLDEIIASVGASEKEVTCPLTREELRRCAERVLNLIACCC